jgi:hypothetical protein
LPVVLPDLPVRCLQLPGWLGLRGGKSMPKSSARKPSLHQVQPRAVGRSEVQTNARVGDQPAPDRWGLVGRGVVADHVHVQLGKHRLINTARNRLNSAARWPGGICEITKPEARFSAHTGWWSHGDDSRGCAAAGCRASAAAPAQCGSMPGSATSRPRTARPRTPLDLLVSDCSSHAWPGLIAQSLQAAGGEPAAPLADRGRVHSQSGADLHVG